MFIGNQICILQREVVKIRGRNARFRCAMIYTIGNGVKGIVLQGNACDSWYFLRFIKINYGAILRVITTTARITRITSRKFIVRHTRLFFSFLLFTVVDTNFSLPLSLSPLFTRAIYNFATVAVCPAKPTR